MLTVSPVIDCYQNGHPIYVAWKRASHNPANSFKYFAGFYDKVDGNWKVIHGVDVFHILNNGDYFVHG